MPPTIQRRTLRFETLDAALAEAEHLVALEHKGWLDRGGNWPIGLTLGHLATWCNFAFDGYPPEVRAPWLMRKLVGLFKNTIINKKMMAGIKIRGIPEGTVGLEPLEPLEGLARYQTAMSRLRSTPPTVANPIFGPLSHAQWINLNLRHAELHLGNLVPR
jgi:hypothetical protein